MKETSRRPSTRAPHRLSSPSVMKLSRIRFSGHDDEANIDPELIKGWRKYYNSYTERGRFNVSASTLAAVGLVIAYFVLRPKKKAVEPAKK